MIELATVYNDLQDLLHNKSKIRSFLRETLQPSKSLAKTRIPNVCEVNIAILN